MLKHAATGAVVGGIIGLMLNGVIVGTLVGAMVSFSIYYWSRRRAGALVALLSFVYAGGAFAQTGVDSGQDLPVFFESRGEGPPVLLVHGGMMDRRMWQPQWEDLGEGLRLIRFDVRGAGESPASEPFFAADDMLAILDALGVEQVTVVGLSNGGAFAVDFALAYPERVRKLVLAEPGLTGFAFDSSVMRQQQVMVAAFRARDMAAATEAALASPAFEYTRTNPAAWAAVESLVRRNVGSFAMFPRYRYHEPRAVDELSRLSMPTVLIVSEFAGASALAIAELIERDVPDLVSFTIPNAGHMMNLENPKAFNKVIMEVVGK